MDMGIKYGTMEIVSKVILFKEKEMVLANLLKEVIMYIEVILKIIKWQAMVSWFLMMVENIKVILLMENLMEKVSWHLKMDKYKLVLLTMELIWVKLVKFLKINNQNKLFYLILY